MDITGTMMKGEATWRIPIPIYKVLLVEVCLQVLKRLVINKDDGLLTQ